MTFWNKFNSLLSKEKRSVGKSTLFTEDNDTKELSEKLREKASERIAAKNQAVSESTALQEHTLSDTSAFSLTSNAFETTQSQYMSTGSQVGYDSELIHVLEKEHQYLLEQFANIQELAGNGDFDSILPLLSPLRAVLTDHLYKENLKLYIYLQNVLKDDLDKSSKLRKFRKKSDAIGRVARDFLTKYCECEFTPVMREEFLKELEAVVWGLKERIEKEESILFHLYRLKN